MTIYADTSLFVSFYLEDDHSQEVTRRMRHRPMLWLTPLHRAEWANAVVLNVFRKGITVQDALLARADFARDRIENVWIEASLTETAFERAIEISEKFNTRLGVRSLDTLHVACALELGAKDFWTFDDRQAKLAKAVGLRVT